MKWLLDANGNIVMRNGQPVLVRDDGSEMEFDGPAALSKITALNRENQTFRTDLKTAQTKLEAFGDADPESIEEFLSEMEALGGKDGLEALKQTSKVDLEGFKKTINQTWEEKLNAQKTAHATELAKKDGHIYKLEVSNKFTASPFIAEKLTIPPDMAEATFGQNYKIEDGVLTPYLNGEKIWSKKAPGELADFDEAMEVMVTNYQHRDRILLGSNAKGNGTQQRNQQTNNNKDQNSNLSSVQKIAAGLAELG